MKSSILKKKYDAEVFIRFLEKMIARYPDECIVMVLDNACIHLAKLIQPLLENHQDCFEFLFISLQIPDLNLIEVLWKWMKATVIDNVFFPNVGKIQQAIQGFIQLINQIPLHTEEMLFLKL